MKRSETQSSTNGGHPMSGEIKISAELRERALENRRKNAEEWRYRPAPVEIDWERFHADSKQFKKICDGAVAPTWIVFGKPCDFDDKKFEYDGGPGTRGWFSIKGFVDRENVLVPGEYADWLEENGGFGEMNNQIRFFTDGWEYEADFHYKTELESASRIRFICARTPDLVCDHTWYEHGTSKEDRDFVESEKPFHAPHPLIGYWIDQACHGEADDIDASESRVFSPSCGGGWPYFRSFRGESPGAILHIERFWPKANPEARKLLLDHFNECAGALLEDEE